MNVAYLGVQVVLAAGATLLAALLLVLVMELARLMQAPGSTGVPRAVVARLTPSDTTIRPRAGLAQSTPSRAPPMSLRGQLDEDSGFPPELV